MCVGGALGRLARSPLSKLIGGIPAVPFARVPLQIQAVDILRWPLLVVVLYTALVMLHAAVNGERSAVSAGTVLS